MHHPNSVEMQRLERAQYIGVSANQLQQTDRLGQFQLTNTDQVNSPSSSIEQLKGERNIAKLDPIQIQDLFDKIKAGAKKALEESNNEDKPLTEFDYLKRNIEEIESYDIEVKIEPQEIRTAILYNSLGINFLDIKRLETRMELRVSEKRR